MYPFYAQKSIEMRKFVKYRKGFGVYGMDHLYDTKSRVGISCRQALRLICTYRCIDFTAHRSFSVIVSESK